MWSKQRAGRCTIEMVIVAFAVLCAGGHAALGCDGIVSVAPIGEDMSLVLVCGGTGPVTGVHWYNNDEGTTFPEVAVYEAGSGSEYAPGALLQSWQNVVGPTAGWGTLEASSPFSSRTGLYYVVFKLPEGEVFVHEGAGGGPGIGYYSAGEDVCGFVLAEGEVGLQLRGQAGVELLGAAGKALHGNVGFAADAAFAVAMRLATWPNPSTGPTNIYFSLPRSGTYDLKVYDIRGRLVKVIAAGAGAQGGCTLSWDGTDNAQQKLPAGVYYARLRAGGVTRTQRMVLMH